MSRPGIHKQCEPPGQKPMPDTVEGALPAVRGISPDTILIPRDLDEPPSSVPDFESAAPSSAENERQHEPFMSRTTESSSKSSTMLIPACD